ncbi:MAG: hypothetical protein NTX50_12395, partial [Candidatus Sumerlaeota bacterium]|nr:hypothetical protein [Candidatus Sumerlaeota bacterium]
MNYRKSILSVIMMTWLAATVVSAAMAQSSTPNENAWVTNGDVYAIVPVGGLTYIGGDFTYVGPYSGGGVPIDVITADPVAAFPKVNGSVYACVSDGAGGWYIGGAFTQVGGQTRNNIAHILADGSLGGWNPDANGPVSALAVSGTTV